MNISNKTGLPIIELIYILFAELFYINFEIQGRFMLIAPFILFGYVFYCMFKEPQFSKKILGMLIFILVLSLLYYFFTDSDSIGNVENRGAKRIYAKLSQYLLVFFPLFLYYRTITYATKKQIYIILAIGIASALVLVKAALVIAMQYELVLHSMNEKVLEDANVSLQGYNFVYAFTFIVITCLLIFLKSSEKVWKYLSLALMCYSLFFLLKAQFALSLVTTMISVVYLLYVLNEKPNNKTMFITAGMLVLLFSPFLVGLLSIFDSFELLSGRINEMTNFFSTGIVDVNTDLGYRLNVYWKCIEAFFSSPIWGSRSLDFNGHSTFLCVLADLGILGGYIVYRLFKESYQIESRCMASNVKYFKPLMLQIILMGLTNPIHSVPSNYIMLWFLCPLMIQTFVIRKQ